MLGAVVIVNLKGMLMQVVDVPYLWKKDRPDCVGAISLSLSLIHGFIIDNNILRNIKCIPSDCLVGHVLGFYITGAWFGSGRWTWSGAAHGGLQGSVVSRRFSRDLDFCNGAEEMSEYVQLNLIWYNFIYQHEHRHTYMWHKSTF